MRNTPLRIGITGNRGFIGRHLSNFLALQENITIVPFEKDFFENITILSDFVSNCDAIVHLAALNRHESQEVLYDTNLQLVEKLISACQQSNAKPHIIFSSSTQENKENLYGKSKLEGRQLLEEWATSTHARTTGLIIPNVFGPFGKPFYNSVVATFCHQVANGETPTIMVDSILQLIYINELVEEIHQIILTEQTGKIEIQSRHTINVSGILELLTEFRSNYLENSAFPSLDSPLRLALFNTFRCYIPEDHYPVRFKLNPDNRGTFVEIARTGSSGQFSFSTTNPGITRGNHFHTRKAERFAVIKGKARISLRKIDEESVIEYFLDGEQPAFVDMPIWYTHNITNIGEDELLTLFWINEPYNPTDPDTYFVNV